MRITIFVFLISFSFIKPILCYGQVESDEVHSYNYKAIYRLDFVVDSTNKSNVSTDYWVLYMNDSSSMFTSLKYLRMDSIKRVERLKGNSFGPSMDWYMANGTKNTLLVYKTDNGSSIICHDKIASEISEHYVYQDFDKMDWRLLSDTMTIGDALCYKAEVNFGGREWYAWYSAEIPISDGPYKFSGLPGLIYEIGDADNTWKYSLVNFKKDAVQFSFNCSDTRHEHLSKEKFYKNKRNYYDNRITIMKSMGYSFKDENQSKESYGKDNNWIELYP